MSRRLTVMFAVLIAFTMAAPQFASSAPRIDPRAEREQVRAEAAQVATQIDTNKATLSEVDNALQTLQENLSTQEAALARTETEVAQADKDIVDAQAAIEQLTTEIVILRKDMRRRAVAAYVSPPEEDLLTTLETQDFAVASNERFYVELKSQDDAEVADRLNGANIDLDHQQTKATEAKNLAEAKRVEQSERTDAVRQARSDQQTLYTNVEATIDSQINRSLQLASTDKALSAEIARQQAELVARLAAEKEARLEAERQEAARQKAIQAQAQKDQAANQQQQQQQQTTTTSPPPPPSSGGGGGGGGGGTTTPPPPPPPPTPLPPVSGGGGGTGTGGIPLCTVGGITVNCAIQGSLTNMLNAARASGVSLSGGGYRDPSSQIALRRAHCGTSYYAIYQMPSSQCRPPTAPPGRSQHEIGLAIDFSNCSSRGTACYQWLAGNAGTYGFYNLPSEPWHWSTTGN